LREKNKIKFTDHNKMNINAERINKPVKIKTCSKGAQRWLILWATLIIH
jgi:hypothetical protein